MTTSNMLEARAADKLTQELAVSDFAREASSLARNEALLLHQDELCKRIERKLDLFQGFGDKLDVQRSETDTIKKTIRELQEFSEHCRDEVESRLVEFSHGAMQNALAQQSSTLDLIHESVAALQRDFDVRSTSFQENQERLRQALDVIELRPAVAAKAATIPPLTPSHRVEGSRLGTMGEHGYYDTLSPTSLRDSPPSAQDDIAENAAMTQEVRPSEAYQQILGNFGKHFQVQNAEHKTKYGENDGPFIQRYLASIENAKMQQYLQAEMLRKYAGFVTQRTDQTPHNGVFVSIPNTFKWANLRRVVRYLHVPFSFFDQD